MRAFADGCAAVFWVAAPKVAAHAGRIHPRCNNHRICSARELSFHLHIKRRETPIKSDANLFSAFFNRLVNCATFFNRNRHWFFNKNVLSRIERGNRFARVMMACRRHQNYINVRVVQHFFIIRTSILCAEPQSVTFSTRTA